MRLLPDSHFPFLTRQFLLRTETHSCPSRARVHVTCRTEAALSPELTGAGAWRDHVAGAGGATGLRSETSRRHRLAVSRLPRGHQVPAQLRESHTYWTVPTRAPCTSLVQGPCSHLDAKDPGKQRTWCSQGLGGKQAPLARKVGWRGCWWKPRRSLWGPEGRCRHRDPRGPARDTGGNPGVVRDPQMRPLQSAISSVRCVGGGEGL